MKVFIAALLILGLLTTGMLLNVKYLTDTLYEVRAHLLEIPTPAEEQTDLSVQEARVRDAQALWNKRSRAISLTVNHADLMEAELQFSAAIGAAVAGSRDDYIIACEQLDYALSHLSEMAQVTLKNII